VNKGVFILSKVQFIARADDIGSSHSANLAAIKVANAGIIKNFSLMAPCMFIGEAAEMLADRKDICLGMHTTFNSEWDNVKWKPVSSVGQNCGFVDENGYFLANPSMYADTKPPLEFVIAEIEAQFDKLYKLGFDIKYIDSHMMSELFIDGMDEEIEAFAKRKGILDHMYYYNLPPGLDEFLKNPSNPVKYLKSLPVGQYFIVTHPSLDTEEMRKTGNSEVSGEKVAQDRAKETEIFSGFAFKSVLKLAGCRGIRYDEAVLGERLTVQQVREVYLSTSTDEDKAKYGE